jgi:hypothetical protein
MDLNCKPVHAHAYTVPKSVEQQLRQIKEIVRLVDIGFLEKDHSFYCCRFRKAQLIIEK